MEIIQNNRNSVNIVSIVGNLDTGTAPEAEKVIMACINGGCTKLLINLEKTVYVSSSGLRVMLASAKKLKNIGELRITNLNDTIQEVFDISGFSTILNVDATEEDALAKFA